MRFLADVLYLLGALVYLPILLYQMIFQGKNRRGWGERFGHVSRPADPRPSPRIWVHAVSLGEVNCTPLLVRQIETTLPSASVFVSSTTDTGYARARQLYGSERVFRYPLDFSWVVRRMLDRLRPDLIVLTELEVWYNLVSLAASCGIPIAVINGRLTERSFRRFRWIAPIARRMFQRLGWVGAQDEAIAARFIGLGTPADHVQVTGSLKWDTAQIADKVAGAEELAAAVGIVPDVPLWVCGSTGPGEEALVLDAYRRLLHEGLRVQLAIVPRKPERFDEVAALIRSRDFECVRRSERPDELHEIEAHSQPNVGACGAPAVILGDTMGELRKFYSLASVVFVGRSLVPMGGSDPMEVAALGKPMIAGAYMDNFRAPAAVLEAAGCLGTVDDVGALVSRLCDLVADAEAARRMGDAARDVVRMHQGATSKTVDRLLRLLP